MVDYNYIYGVYILLYKCFILQLTCNHIKTP